jgi:SAM-dependent methyltransferase
MQQLFDCPCCGSNEYKSEKILWDGLVKEWKLTKAEAAYVNRQQGLQCNVCRSNLRSMTLARAILYSQQEYEITLKDFIKQNKKLKILEVNEAGNLSPFFKEHPSHTLVEYPEVDIKKLPFKDNAFDVIIHSDTLEHVDDPMAGLRETLRVQKPGGFTCFTIPFIVGRLSRRRSASEKKSYHGSPGNNEYLVQTEYGSDMWTQVIQAGYDECRLTSLEYPSSTAITGFKKPLPQVKAKRWSIRGY